MRSLTTGISSSANAASALSSARQASKASSAIVSEERALRSRIRRNAKLRFRHSRYALRGANSAGSVCPADEASAQEQASAAATSSRFIPPPKGCLIDSAGRSITHARIGHRSGPGSAARETVGMSSRARRRDRVWPPPHRRDLQRRSLRYAAPLTNCVGFWRVVVISRCSWRQKPTALTVSVRFRGGAIWHDF
jgi:hypothetical protein